MRKSEKRGELVKTWKDYIIFENFPKKVQMNQ